MLGDENDDDFLNNLSDFLYGMVSFISLGKVIWILIDIELEHNETEIRETYIWKF